MRHLERPRRERRTGREAGQSTKDLEEDVLRQNLREAPIVDKAVDIGEDETFVGVDDDGEGSLVSSLRAANDRGVRLLQR